MVTDVHISLNMKKIIISYNDNEVRYTQNKQIKKKKSCG